MNVGGREVHGTRCYCLYRGDMVKCDEQNAGWTLKNLKSPGVRWDDWAVLCFILDDSVSIMYHLTDMFPHSH